jgi:predicted 3-demethylubiquinone-9 3-methyltransferase (glyoxalase superfamily)
VNIRGGTDTATKARPKIYTHLWYAKEAEEAASFYASIFPDWGSTGSRLC